MNDELIGKPEDWCKEAQFIGPDDKISYLISHEDSTSTLLVQEISSHKTVEVQKFGEEVLNHAFASDGKSYIYSTLEIFENDRPRVIAGKQERLKLKLYQQKLGNNLKPEGKPQVLTPPDLTMSAPYHSNCFWAPDGQKVLFTASHTRWKEEPHTIISLIDLNNKKIQKMMEGRYFLCSPPFSPDGQQFAVLKLFSSGSQQDNVINSGKSDLFTIEIMSLETQKVTSLPAIDIISLIGWTENGKGLIVTKQEGTQEKLYLLDIETQKLTPKDLQHITAIKDPPIISKNKKYIGLVGQSFYHPEEVYISDLNDFKIKKVSSVNKKIDLTKIRAHSLKWKSVDGIEIEGTLVYPQGYKEGQNVPLIVSVHGGPTAANSESFIGTMWYDNFSPAVVSSFGYATLFVSINMPDKGHEPLIVNDKHHPL